MLNDPRSHGLWETTAPPAPETPPLAGALKADVAIVGCGYTGLSAALHLAEAGAKVVALEAVEIGYGGAGRNVGLVNAGMWVMPNELPAALGADYGERALTLLGGAPAEVWTLIEKHNIACDPVRAGTLHCAVGPKGLAEIQERARQWGARGAPVSVLDAGEAARRVGANAYSGALLDMRGGNHPAARLCPRARRARPSRRARRSTPAAPRARFERGGRTLDLAQRRRFDRGRMDRRGDRRLWRSRRGRNCRREQVRLPYFNFATMPLTPPCAARSCPIAQGCWDTREILSSFRYDSLGPACLRQRRRAARRGPRHPPGVGEAGLAQTLPRLGDVEFDAEWYGFIGMTDNALPRFHRLAPNVVSFSGYNGRGIGPGTAFGRVMADHVLGAARREGHAPAAERTRRARLSHAERGLLRSPALKSPTRWARVSEPQPSDPLGDLDR